MNTTIIMRKLINGTGLSVKELAEVMQCDDGNIYRWMTGTKPTAEKLLKLQALFIKNSGPQKLLEVLESGK